MQPRWKALSAILVVTAAAVGGMIAWSHVDRIGFANSLGFNPSSKLVGEPLPAFSLRDVRSGETVTPEQLQGRVAVIVFWATWCPFCHDMMETLVRLEKDPALRERVVIVAIDVREDEVHGAGEQENAVRRHLEQQPYSFRVLLGGQAVMGAYRVQSIPAVVVADSRGVIRYSGVTAHGDEELREAIELASRP